jgi:hypothetical protein
MKKIGNSKKVVLIHKIEPGKAGSTTLEWDKHYPIAKEAS